MQTLIKELQAMGVLKNPLVLSALKTVDRADFVPKEKKVGSASELSTPDRLWTNYFPAVHCRVYAWPFGAGDGS